MSGHPTRRAVFWGVVRDGAVLGILIALPIIALMWGTAAL
jgi:hypothetical protein